MNDLGEQSVIGLVVVVTILLVAISAPLFGNAMLRLMNERFWLKKNYPNHKKWPEKATEVMHFPVSVDFFTFPLSGVLIPPLVVGLVMEVIGNATELSTITIIGKTIYAIPALGLFTLFIGTIWEAALGGGNPTVIRKSHRERALKRIDSLLKKEGEDTKRMQGYYRLWQALHRDDELNYALAEGGDIHKKHSQFVKGKFLAQLVLPQKVVTEIENTIREVVKIYNKVLEKDVLSEQLNRSIAQRIAKLEKIPEKYTIETSESNDGSSSE